MQIDKLNGFYVGFFSAAGGEGAVILVFCNGVITGADVGAFEYDGQYTIEQTGEADVKATVKVPPGQQSILGISGGDAGLTYEVQFILPPDFLERPFVRLETPYGPVNMRLVKIRNLS
jgi:hypothetical protein